MNMFSNKKELSNVVSILAYCSYDNTFLLLLDEDRADYWIPSSVMDDQESWKENLQIFKKKLFDYEIINEKLLKIFKIWTLKREYFHLIFQVNLPKEVKTNCKTHTQLGKVGWFTCSEIINLKPLLRSLEILEVTHNYSPNIYRNTEKVTGEIVPTGSLTEIRETDILVTSDTCDSQLHIDLLDSAGLPPTEQCDLYEEFFMNTYPCIYMNRISFSKIMARYNHSCETNRLFNAADVWKRNFLTFQDFLYLIAVMEPYTDHYGTLGELRCQYIFRYYDYDDDGKLDYCNFQDLISDIQIAKNGDIERNSIEKHIEVITKGIDLKPNSLMTFDQFYSNVLLSKICDTSLLLRFTESYNQSIPDGVPEFLRPNLNSSNPFAPSLSYSTEQDKSSDYKIVVKTVILKPGENPLEIKDFQFLEDTMTKSFSEEFKILSSLKLSRVHLQDIDAKIDELLLALKYFCTEICQSPICCGEFEFEEKDAYTWGSAYIEKLGITLILMCQQLKDILMNEPRLLEIKPPAYIMGDLHGNFHDLICFEKTLWPNGIPLLPARLIFLGDYVDRGNSGIEVIMYLFAHKVKNPEKLFLIRGNHEIREIQKLFTFQRECISKFGATLGTSIWKAVNEVFDVMPLAAVIDNKVFCCHGGIPPPWLCPVLSVINCIPCPLVNCEKQSPLAWTLMWNDPLKNVTRNSIQELELLANDGFLINASRGTGFVFSCDALEKFLMTNNLSHVVRAHEVVRAGFQVHQKGKLLTVFSSSGYCGGKNYAGSVLVADKLLRVFMVDTGMIENIKKFD